MGSDAGGHAFDVDAAREEWRRKGVPEAQIEEALSAIGGSNGAHEFSIEPENRDVARLYRGVRTQWRIETVVAGRLFLTRHHGIDYAVVPTVARALRIRLTERVWSGLQIMEDEALAIYGRRETAALQGP